jgi:pimeloyl-ACP methyl ester carboxylesterase
MSTFTTSDGLSLHFEDAGEGLPLLCLSGLTRTTRDFDYVAPHLSGVRMIRLDYRGRGGSDWDADWQNYALPIEGRDVMELLQYLGLSQIALLGTSRGGLNAMGLAAVAPDVLLGVALNDIGPELNQEGLDFIMTYLGVNPAATSYEAQAEALSRSPGFCDIPQGRWLTEAKLHYRQGEDGLQITYDPNLRQAVEAAGHKGIPDLWPFFDALPDRPLALIWGVNSELLSEATVREMQRRRPDMILAEVAGRGHIPFLDEPESLAALNKWIGALR